MDIHEYEARERARLERNLAYMEAGVNFIDIKMAYIDEGVRIGKGTTIYPCAVIEGDVEIGENCVIGQNTRIKDSVIGDGTSVQSSVILESKVGCDTTIGPFAYLRPGSDIGNGCRVGDFVEIKNSKLGDGAKASHLTYVGDSDVGEKVNLGCGVVFVNYDGSKNRGQWLRTAHSSDVMSISYRQYMWEKALMSPQEAQLPTMCLMVPSTWQEPEESLWKAGWREEAS